MNLQCQVSAPIHEINPQELNFTIIWVKKFGYENADEEIIYPSELASTGLEVYIHESRFVRDKEVVLMLSSSLTIHFDQERELGANYWCRVLVKDLENYSYEHEGDSISTKVEKQDFYSNTVIFYPPCERGSSFHQSGLTCVNNGKSGHLVTSSTSELPVGLKDIFWSDAVIVVIFLGLLIGSLAIVLLLGTYSCAIHMSNRRKAKTQLVKGEVLMM